MIDGIFHADTDIVLYVAVLFNYLKAEGKSNPKATSVAMSPAYLLPRFSGPAESAQTTFIAVIAVIVIVRKRINL